MGFAPVGMGAMTSPKMAAKIAASLQYLKINEANTKRLNTTQTQFDQAMVELSLRYGLKIVKAERVSAWKDDQIRNDNEISNKTFTIGDGT